MPARRTLHHVIAMRPDGGRWADIPSNRGGGGGGGEVDMVRGALASVSWMMDWVGIGEGGRAGGRSVTWVVMVDSRH